MRIKNYITFILLLLSSFAYGQGLQWIPIRIGPTTNYTFTFLTSVSKAPTGASQTTITTSSISTAGANVAVVVISDFSANGTGTLSDNKGNAWTLAKSQGAGGSACRALGYYCNLTSTGTGHTFTYTANGALSLFSCMFVMTYSTGGGVASVDQTNGANGTTSTTPSAGSITPAFNNELVVAGLSINRADAGITSIGSSFNLNASFASVLNWNVCGGAAYNIQTTTTTTNPVWTVAASSPAPSTSATILFSLKL